MPQLVQIIKIRFLKTYSVCFLKILNGATCIKSWYLYLFLKRFLVECVREVTGLSRYFPTVNMFSLILIFSMFLYLYYNDKFQPAGKKRLEKYK